MQIALHHPSYAQSNRPRAGIHPDAVRILGYSSTIALNACVFALLLIPLHVPLPMPDDPRPTWVVQLRKPPPAPMPVPVVQPQRPPIQARAQPRPQPQVAPDPAPVVVEQGELPALEIAPVVRGPVAPSLASGPPGPAAIRLEYAHAPPPPYPRTALRRDITGTVLLQVLVDVDGRPLRVDVAESSGHRDLDTAARRQVLNRWIFRPAIRDGRAVQAIGLIPIEFSLN